MTKRQTSYTLLLLLSLLKALHRGLSYCHKVQTITLISKLSAGTNPGFILSVCFNLLNFISQYDYLKPDPGCPLSHNIHKCTFPHFKQKGTHNTNKKKSPFSIVEGINCQFFSVTMFVHKVR